VAAARSFHPGIEVVCLSASWPTPGIRRIRRCIVLALSEIMHTLCAGRASLFSRSSLSLPVTSCTRALYICSHNNAYLLIRRHPTPTPSPLTPPPPTTTPNTPPIPLPYPPSASHPSTHKMSTPKTRAATKHLKNNHTTTATDDLTVHLIIIYY